MRLQSLKILFVIVFLLLAVRQGGWAQSILVVTEQWPPYSFTENGQVKGLVTEVVRAVMDHSGLEYEICCVPFARAYRMAATHENVLIYTLFRLPNRESLFKWIKLEGLATRMYLFSPTMRPDVAVDTLEDARKYRIGVTRDTSTHHFLVSKGFVEGENLFPVSSERQIILLADPQARRIDLSTGDELSLAHWLSVNGYPADFWSRRVFLFSEDFYMAFGLRTSDEVVRKVRQSLEEVRRMGVLQEIVVRHGRMVRNRTGIGR